MYIQYRIALNQKKCIQCTCFGVQPFIPKSALVTKLTAHKLTSHDRGSVASSKHLLACLQSTAHSAGRISCSSLPCNTPVELMKLFQSQQSCTAAKAVFVIFPHNHHLEGQMFAFPFVSEAFKNHRENLARVPGRLRGGGSAEG